MTRVLSYNIRLGGNGHVKKLMIGNYWEGTWEDTITGKTMRGRGTEFWTMQDGKIAVWEATFNVWEDGAGPATPIV